MVIYQLFWQWKILFLLINIYLLVNAFEYDSNLNPSVSGKIFFK